jgi:RHS repeat-associated protein
VTTFGYDAAKRLNQMSGVHNGSWTRSSAGDVLSHFESGFNTVYTQVSGSHQLQTKLGAGGVSNYTYDLSGYIDSIVDPAVGTILFERDSLGRQSKAFEASGAFTVDRKYTAEGAVGFEVTGGHEIARLGGGYDRVDGLNRVVVAHGFLGVAQIENGDLGTLEAVVQDLQGSPIARFDTAGGVVSAAEFDVWGNELAADNPDHSRSWLGLPRDVSMDMVSTGDRLYRPGDFVFLGPEPLGFHQTLSTTFAYDPYKTNPYQYSNGNPASYQDPNGRNPIAAYVVAESAFDLGVWTYDVYLLHEAIVAGDDAAIAEQATMMVIDIGFVLAPGYPNVVSPAVKVAKNGDELFDFVNTVVKTEGDDVGKAARESVGAGKNAPDAQQMAPSGKKGGPGSGMAGQTVEQLLDSRESHLKQIEIHKQKLAEYIADPMAKDNKGYLENASSEEVWLKIYNSRIDSLERTILKHENEIGKIDELLGAL